MGAYSYSAWEYIHPTVGWQWTLGSDSDTPAFRPRVTINKNTSGLQSATELYRPTDRRLSATLVPPRAARGCRVVSATNPHGR
jgi:hypothetical protein